MRLRCALRRPGARPAAFPRFQLDVLSALPRLAHGTRTGACDIPGWLGDLDFSWQPGTNFRVLVLERRHCRSVTVPMSTYRTVTNPTVGTTLYQDFETKLCCSCAFIWNESSVTPRGAARVCDSRPLRAECADRRDLSHALCSIYGAGGGRHYTIDQSAALSQLASLAECAGASFESLARDASSCSERADALAARVASLARRLPQAEAAVYAEADPLRFRHVAPLDYSTPPAVAEGLFSRATAPAGVLRAYEGCRPPPALHLVDAHTGTDPAGESSAQLRYSDPAYFRVEWARAQLDRCGPKVNSANEIITLNLRTVSAKASIAGQVRQRSIDTDSAACFPVFAGRRLRSGGVRSAAARDARGAPAAAVSAHPPTGRHVRRGGGRVSSRRRAARCCARSRRSRP